MAKPNVKFYPNRGISDTPRIGTPNNADFFLVTHGTGAGAHSLVLTGQTVLDGNPTGTRSAPLVSPTAVVEIDKTFIDDLAIMKQVPLAGTNQGKQSGGNTRYVFCINFDGPTQSIPQLEAWDDATAGTNSSQVLGGGTPANSYIKGVATTNGAPGGVDWVAGGFHKNLSGSGGTNVLPLDSVVVPSGGKDLYCNLCARWPAAANPGAFNIQLAVRYSWN